MISIISSAKSMNFSKIDDKIPSSHKTESKTTNKILLELKNLSVKEIMEVMNISEKIALLNYNRLNIFQTLPIKQALYAYDGDVYKNINIQSLDMKSVKFAQQHLHILSALYGLLKPLDLIKAYRLEMSTKLDNIAKFALNKLWQDQITKDLYSELQTHKNKFIINIASNEYAASINTKIFGLSFININFREYRNNKLKNVAINAKRARGMLVNYIIKNYIDHPNDLIDFNENGYKFNKELSDQSNIFFSK